jgi:hypothetical protein
VNPELVPVGQYISILKDAAFLGGILIIGWKVRVWTEPIIEFFKRVEMHMQSQEAHIQALLVSTHGLQTGLHALQGSINTLTGNHLAHIESYLKDLSEDQKAKEK